MWVSVVVVSFLSLLFFLFSSFLHKHTAIFDETAFVFMEQEQKVGTVVGSTKSQGGSYDRSPKRIIGLADIHFD